VRRLDLRAATLLFDEAQEKLTLFMTAPF